MKINTINRPGTNQLGVGYSHESGTVTKVILELLRLMEPSVELPVSIIEFTDLPDYSNEYLFVLQQNVNMTERADMLLQVITDAILKSVLKFAKDLNSDYLIEIKTDFTNYSIIFTVAITS